MRNKWLILLLVLSLAINLAAIATIAFHWLRRQQFKTAFEDQSQALQQFGQDMTLSREQKKYMRSQRKQLQAMVRQNHQQVKQYRLEILELLKQPEADTTKIYALVQEINQLQTLNEKHLLENMIQLKGTLSPEQFDRHVQKLNFFMHNRQHPFGRMRRGQGRGGDVE
ncbi:periplasmic heavy metal sensor [candidate division KSB1 bacterium]|nr:periplasmic heavy metal sensor [candidate division KSB1 bacterium]